LKVLYGRETGLLCAMQVQQKQVYYWQQLDLVSLIIVQRRTLLILKGCMQRFLNHLAEGLFMILDSAGYNFTIIDKIKFLTQDLIKRRFLNDFERRISNVTLQKSCTI
jgi:hypothetical protein